MPAGAASQQPALRGPNLPALASWTYRPFGPSQRDKILPAYSVLGKPGLEFLKRSGIILHTPKHYILGLLEPSE